MPIATHCVNDDNVAFVFISFVFHRIPFSVAHCKEKIMSSALEDLFKILSHLI